MRTKFLNHIIFVSIFLTLLIIPKVHGQDKLLVQIRAYNENIELISNVSVSINGGEFISTGDEGIAYINIPPEDLPPEEIETEDTSYEAASWNYSSGRLEIIIRPRTYKTILAQVREGGIPVQNVFVRMKSNLAINSKTNSTGEFQLNVPLDFNQDQSESLVVDGYEVLDVLFDGLIGAIEVKELASPNIEPSVTPDQVIADQEFSYIDVSALDTISSITDFYNFMRGAEYESITPEQKKIIDEKFMVLLTQTEDSLRFSVGKELLGQINKTSSVQEDILILIELAEKEEILLLQEKDDFDQKISVILEKLNNKGLDLTEAERADIMADLARLIRLLESNKNRFFANQLSFWSVLNSIEGLLIEDFDKLEYRLVENEKLRQGEKEAFQQKLFITLGVILIMVLLTGLSIYLARKFRKQEKQITVAHEEVKRVNNHLEDLVEEKTLSLKETNYELDTFLYRSSHDLKRPLTSIMGLGNVAKLTLGDDANALFEKTMITATEMDHMLDKLTMFSLINYPQEKSEIDLEEVIGRIQAKTSKQRIGEVQFSYTVGKGIHLVTHPGLFESMLFNLVENAFKFSVLNKTEQATVNLEIFSQGSDVIINIQDSGPGINREIVDKIWDMYFRGTNLVSGNGLGLYITGKAVIVLKGDIELASNEPGKTVFSVCIPGNSEESVSIVKEEETNTLV